MPAGRDALRAEFPFLLGFDRRPAGPGVSLLDEVLRAPQEGDASR
ncbi:hypothetical protein ABZ362_27410 [Streptomyces sp. NPDC005951]